jgi:hypothetical protein
MAVDLSFFGQNGRNAYSQAFASGGCIVQVCLLHILKYLLTADYLFVPLP